MEIQDSKRGPEQEAIYFKMMLGKLRLASFLKDLLLLSLSVDYAKFSSQMWLLPGKHCNPSRLSWCSFSAFSIFPGYTTAFFFSPLLSENGLLQGQSRTGGSCSKTPNSYHSFLMEAFNLHFYNYPAPSSFLPGLEASCVRGLNPCCHISGITNTQEHRRINQWNGSQ